VQQSTICGCQLADGKHGLWRVASIFARNQPSRPGCENILVILASPGLLVGMHVVIESRLSSFAWMFLVELEQVHQQRTNEVLTTQGNVCLLQGKNCQCCSASKLHVAKVQNLDQM
jgi:hypothetical protein